MLNNTYKYWKGSHKNTRIYKIIFICIFVTLLPSELGNIVLHCIPLIPKIFSYYIDYFVFKYTEPYYAENYKEQNVSLCVLT